MRKIMGRLGPLAARDKDVNTVLRTEIIRASVEHLDDIMVIENLSFAVPWSRKSITEEITENKFAIYMSASVDGTVIGYAGMWSICGEGHITNIAVHPEFRGNGVGSLLVEGLIGEAKAEGITRMTLEVRKSNITAQNLYKKYGFAVYGSRKAYYADNKEDALIMWKDEV